MSQDPQAPDFIEPGELQRESTTGRFVVVDVRSADEFAAGHVPGAINVPLDQLPSRLAELPSDAAIVTVCNFGGARSCGAAEQLRSLGRQDATPLRGGMDAWRRQAQEGGEAS